MRALILADGERPPAALLARLRKEADLFIATDGAANAPSGAGPAPDVVLGDFDSLQPETRPALPDTTFVHVFDQDACDLDKAIAYALERGAARITLTGAGGGRIDHTLTAFSLLLKYHSQSQIRLAEGWGEAQAVCGAAEFQGRPGDTLSLICFAPVEGVTAEGVKWPLRGETLLPGSRGVSNEFVAATARVSVRSGVLIACHLKKTYHRDTETQRKAGE
jgi:thiamine pyrophosphokinase